MTRRLLGCALLAVFSAEAARHYIFFNRDRERIADPSFLATAAIEGAQLKYVWSELEQVRGEYRFEAIRCDRDFLRSKGKRLFIQLQDVSFDDRIRNSPKDVPAVRQASGGWVASRWDPEVRARFLKLLAALGREFDGGIEGINLPETSIEVETKQGLPPGFTFDRYRDAVLDTMAALKRAFPKSVAMQYANFMPGEWLPGDDRGYLRSVYSAARKLGVAVGGPDLLPFRPGQLNHSYPLIRGSAGAVPTAIAVQTGNYEHKDPTTGARLSAAELLRFATESLRVDYIFWSTQEPYYSRDVLPMLRARSGR